MRDMPLNSDLVENLTIDGVSEPNIIHYFNTLNAEDYHSVAKLFASAGALYPPFEEPIVGYEAIATYLEQEASGMRLFPKRGTQDLNQDGETHVHVMGKVQTPMFRVNVSWRFVLNAQHEILSARIQLLASPQELLKLRR
jgi:hypothetical protein